jgi:hypothetical protein
MEKDLSIVKEVLGQMVDGVYADAVNHFIKSGDKDVRAKSQNILSLRKDIRDAETKEELEAINEKLKAYSFSPERSIGD